MRLGFLNDELQVWDYLERRHADPRAYLRSIEPAAAAMDGFNLVCVQISRHEKSTGNDAENSGSLSVRFAYLTNRARDGGGGGGVRCEPVVADSDINQDEHCAYNVRSLSNGTLYDRACWPKVRHLERGLHAVMHDPATVADEPTLIERLFDLFEYAVDVYY